MTNSANQGASMATAAGNGNSTVHELFALTDEQILEIEPEAQDLETVAPQTASGHAPKGNPSTSETQSASQDPSTSAPARVGASAWDDRKGDGVPGAQPLRGSGQAGLGVPQEPPRWVAEAMNDPQRSGEARAFWEGTQKAQQEAAAYREVFAKPEEARAVAERARVLDEIDRAYFGATGNSAEQTSAARTQLAQMMLQENPAAFREMVFAGLRALEETGKQGSTEAGNVTAATGGNKTAVQAGQQSSHDSSRRGGLGMTENNSGRDAQLAAYVAFEKAANEDLERSVGGAIERTIEQAFPNIAKADRAPAVGAQHAAPLQARLQSAIRQDVEKALHGDRQLSEQIALIISGRRPGDAGTPTPRFDGDTRAQVVRLIDERAKQLVPGAAKRVLQDWTQTTLATHRSRTRQNETAAARSDLAPANSDTKTPPLRSGNTSQTSDRNKSGGNRSGKVDYRKLSDEQILNL